MNPLLRFTYVMTEASAAVIALIAVGLLLIA